MRIPLSWLNDMFQAPLHDLEAVSRALTDAGLEVEGLERVAPGFERVVTGRITRAVAHPNADSLRVCQTDVGTGELLQIVTGAANVQEGDVVPVALAGAVLPGGKEIKAAKLRGVESSGMYCSLRELALPGGVDGVEVLAPDTPLGRPAAEVLGVGEVVLEIAVLANRPDALSIRGVARELAAAGLGTLQERALEELPASGDSGLVVELAAADLCPRYAGLVLEGITVGESPEWLRRRLEAAGLRSLSNVVDVTNYVMLEEGQPLHAFDRAAIALPITPRRARAGEHIVTLDGVDRELGEQMLVIADAHGPQAIAGVMGGASSQVQASTKAIVLESAYFDPASVRRTGRALGLTSESSYRFERGVDPEATLRALRRAAQLLGELAGARVAGPACDVKVAPDFPASLVVKLRPGRLARVLGAELPLERAVQGLEAIGFEVKTTDPWEVRVPGWRRHDVTREIDLIEEIARLIGYDRIPATLMPLDAPGDLGPRERLVRRVRAVLEGAGLNEAITTSLLDESSLERSGAPLEGAVRLANPLAEMGILRTAMWPGLLEVARRNHAHGESDVAVYELGKTYHQLPDGSTQEPRWVAFLVMGEMARGVWKRAPQALVADFGWAKGLVERILDDLELEEVVATPVSDLAAMHPGRAARLELDGQSLGGVAEVHPAVYEAYDLPPGGRAAVGWLSLDVLESACGDARRSFMAFGRYPAVLRDLAVVVPEAVPAAEVLELARRGGGALLEEVALFDRYQGPQIPENRVSLGLRLRYRTGERTLTDEDVEPVHARIVELIQSAFGGAVRER